MRERADSLPPASMMSQVPDRSRPRATPIAVAPDAQALAVVKLGPRAQVDGDLARGHARNAARERERRNPLRPPGAEVAELGDVGAQTVRAHTQYDTDSLRFPGVAIEARVRDGLSGGGEGELDEAVRVPGRRPAKFRRGLEIRHLAGEVDGQPRQAGIGRGERTAPAGSPTPPEGPTPPRFPPPASCLGS